MAEELVKFETRGKVAEVTLNNPERLNAVNRAMQERLQEIWREFDDNPGLRVAIVTGAGDRAFCAGADLGDWVDKGGPGHQKRSDHMGAEALVKYTPARLPTWKPVIVAVNGLCAGAGLHFVHDSDIIIAAENATFFDPHLAVGQVAAGEPIGLTRRLPFGVVMAMVLLGKEFRLTATRARELGLVLEVLPGEALMERARELATIITRQAPNATALSKKAIYSGLDLGLSDAYNLGSYILQSNWGSAEAVEGPLAFTEKRPPFWNVG